MYLISHSQQSPGLGSVPCIKGLGTAPCFQGHTAAGHRAAVHTQVRLTRAHVMYPKPHTSSVTSRDFLGVTLCPHPCRIPLKEKQVSVGLTTRKDLESPVSPGGVRIVPTLLLTG